MEEGKRSGQRAKVFYLKRSLFKITRVENNVDKDSCCKHLLGEATKAWVTLEWSWSENQACEKVNVLFTPGSHFQNVYYGKI